MRRGEAIAIRFTPIGERAMRPRSESEAGTVQVTKLLKGSEPSTRKLVR